MAIKTVAVLFLLWTVSAKALHSASENVNRPRTWMPFFNPGPVLEPASPSSNSTVPARHSGTTSNIPLNAAQNMSRDNVMYPAWRNWLKTPVVRPAARHNSSATHSHHAANGYNAHKSTSSIRLGKTSARPDGVLTNPTWPPRRFSLHRSDGRRPHQRPGEQEVGGCRKLSSCSCQSDDGSYIDLTPLGNTDNTPRFRDVPDFTGMYSYSWNPCYGFNEGNCNNVGMCQWVPDASPAYYNLGNQSAVDFEISSDRGLMIKYIGDGGLYVAFRQSYVQLVCDEGSEANFTADGEPAPLSGVYYFTLRSRYACPQGRSNATTTPPITTPTPGVITVTTGPGPSPDPIYNLKTVVELLFCLAVTAAVGVVVLLLLLVAVMMKGSSSTSESSHDTWPAQEKKRPLP